MTADVSPRMPTAPSAPVSAGACDSHTHVFGPVELFPFATTSSYLAPSAPFAVHAAMLQAVGVDRAVVVQPAPYGTDSRALVDALQQSRGALRGVATAKADASEEHLTMLFDAGVRALRFTEVLDRGTGKRFSGSVGIDQLAPLARAMKRMGWHAQLWVRCEDIPACVEECRRRDLPVVIEHMGYFDAARGVHDVAFQRLLEIVRAGDVWVKLAVCRVASPDQDYAIVRPFHQALVEANPTRLVWASDWPFVRMGSSAPDVGKLLDLFHSWVDDEPVRHMILVSNPARLYGFD